MVPAFRLLKGGPWLSDGREEGEAAITGEPNKSAGSSSAFPTADRSASAFHSEMEEFTDRYHCRQR